MRLASSRLGPVVGAVVFLDSMFFAAISPLLPELSHQLHLSKLSAGVMTAGYPAGMLIASLPGGALAVRRGPRFAVVVGISLLIASTAAFGVLHSAAALDLARLAEGVGGSCSWAGGLAWLVAATDPEQRGAVMGRALGAAIGGALFGPVVGAVASALGRPLLFCVLAGLSLLLLVPVLALTDTRESSQQPVTDALRVLRRPAVAGAMGLMVLPAVVAGAYNVLVPLRMHDLGAGAALIGATFLIGAGVEAVISPVAGRLSDRHGRTTLLRGALLALAAAIACFTLPGRSLVLVVLVIVTVSMLGVFWAPVMALLADVAELNGIDQAHAAALMNLAWAAGQIVGAAGGGAAAKSFGDLVPTLAITATCVITFLWLRSSRLTGSRLAPAA